MRVIKYCLYFAILCIFFGVIAVFAIYKYLEPSLPDIATLKELKLQQPMQIYSAEGELIAEYGEVRRIPLKYEQIPPRLIEAFISIEDRRFYDHYGIDPIGITRSALVYVKNGFRPTQGASTITQQLARNIYLTPERSLKRKISEVFISLKIEKEFSKQEIIELYLNKIFLGHRAYGVGAAAFVYFGKKVNELTLAEMATLAALPKTPSRVNPITSPIETTKRRNIVLQKMLEEGYINKTEYQQAINEKMISQYHEAEIAFSAPYVAEMVRQEMIRQFGEDDSMTRGYKVYTTISKKNQLAAEEALRNNILDYEIRRSLYRGPAKVLWKENENPLSQPVALGILKKERSFPPLEPAVVMSLEKDKATLLRQNGTTVFMTLNDMRWAGRTKVSPEAKATSISPIVQAGQLIYIRPSGDKWMLSQIPLVNSALVSINSDNGAIIALVGGFDFRLSKFNRVTQSIRQVGSTIKPFIYAAALDKGMTLATILNDVPITRWDERGNVRWRPKNSPPKYDGPLRIRVGLGLSKNVMSVRTIRAIGVDYAAEYLQRFGFASNRIGRHESLALGAAAVTPLQVVRGYAVFVNGGYLVDPYLIARIENAEGKEIFVAKPKVVCSDCNLPVIYGETEKSELLTQHDLEDSVYSHQSNIRIMDDESTEEDVVPDYMSLPDIEVGDDNTASSNSVNSNRQGKNNLSSVKPVAKQPDLFASKELYAPHVISTQLAFLIKSALKSNVAGEPNGGWLPTGWRAAKELKRSDIGGKTGTTNQSKDAWFSGFGSNVVTTVWVGFDDHRQDLGRREAGAYTAQPAWNQFMKVILEGRPEKEDVVPPGIKQVLIDMRTGNLASKGQSGTRMEYFIEGTEPTRETYRDTGMMIIDSQGNQQDIF